ncbi:hypothetical protein FB451DRAFT_1399593 [Mycena latifolia]|nr:hypothetical protein FB451DRAFT_1399593 [Mycena latifolia]
MSASYAAVLLAAAQQAIKISPNPPVDAHTLSRVCSLTRGDREFLLLEQTGRLTFAAFLHGRLKQILGDHGSLTTLEVLAEGIATELDTGNPDEQESSLRPSGEFFVVVGALSEAPDDNLVYRWMSSCMEGGFAAIVAACGELEAPPVKPETNAISSAPETDAILNKIYRDQYPFGPASLFPEILHIAC